MLFDYFEQRIVKLEKDRDYWRLSFKKEAEKNKRQAHLS
jgi:hypothetical protein